MVLSFSPVYHPVGDRRVCRSPHRVKAKVLTLGATRSRLIQVLWGLGLYVARVEARRLHEREMARLVERQRLERIAREREVARLLEERKAARLLKERIVYDAMTEERKAAWRLEEEIVSWLTVSEADA